MDALMAQRELDSQQLQYESLIGQLTSKIDAINHAPRSARRAGASSGPASAQTEPQSDTRRHTAITVVAPELPLSDEDDAMPAVLASGSAGAKRSTIVANQLAGAQDSQALRTLALLPEGSDAHTLQLNHIKVHIDAFVAVTLGGIASLALPVFRK